MQIFSKILLDYKSLWIFAITIKFLKLKKEMKINREETVLNEKLKTFMNSHAWVIFRGISSKCLFVRLYKKFIAAHICTYIFAKIHLKIYSGKNKERKALQEIID